MIAIDGVTHEVNIVTFFYSFAQGNGECKASCICGWWDAQNFAHDPATQNRAPAERFAAYKLQCAAYDHLPAAKPQAGGRAAAAMSAGSYLTGCLLAAAIVAGAVVAWSAYVIHKTGRAHRRARGCPGGRR